MSFIVNIYSFRVCQWVHLSLGDILLLNFFFTRVCCSYVPCSFWLSGNVWLDNCFHHPTDKLTTYFCCSFVHYAVQHSSSTIYISRQAVAFAPEKYVYFAWNHLNIFFLAISENGWKIWKMSQSLFAVENADWYRIQGSFRQHKWSYTASLYILFDAVSPIFVLLP